jgi:hypothetical protein
MKYSKSTLIGLLVSMFIGLIIGAILWWAGKTDASGLSLSVGVGLCYLHIIWYRDLNKSKSDTKVKGNLLV